MALNSAIQFEVRQGGSDTNGGGFKSGASGTDWTLQDAAQYSVTDAVTAGTTTITSVTASFGTDVVGNTLYIQGGTGSISANWYEITSRTNSTTIVVDRSTGLSTGTGATLKIGGAFATPGVLHSVAGGVGGQLVSGQKGWVKYNATAMQCTTSTSGPAGPLTITSAVAFSLEGYDQTRGDRTGNRPSYKWTASAPGSLTYLITLPGVARQVVANMNVDGNSVNNVGGITQTGNRSSVLDSVAQNCNGTSGVGFNLAGSNCSVTKCLASTCITGFQNGGNATNCDATGCTTSYTGLTVAIKCLARGGTTGFTASATGGLCHQCTADSATGQGFNVTGATCLCACLATNCTGSGTGFAASTNICIMYSCAYYNNTTNVSGTPLVNEGAIALSADPYVNQAGADFRPNTTSGGGSSLRNAGIGTYGQTDNADVGAVQHTDPSATTTVFSGEF